MKRIIFALSVSTLIYGMSTYARYGNRLWCVNGNNVVRFSLDNGQTFSEKNLLNKNYHFYGVYFVDSLIGWIVGGYKDSNGIALKTRDGGKNWTVTTYSFPVLPAPVVFLRVIFFNRYNGLIITNSEYILRTCNGGYAWLALRGRGAIEDSLQKYLFNRR
jgi:photosystem II stability/assembly factor-like uncharacterized protein